MAKKETFDYRYRSGDEAGAVCWVLGDKGETLSVSSICGGDVTGLVQVVERENDSLGEMQNVLQMFKTDDNLQEDQSLGLLVRLLI